ncbi:MAG: MCE family protein, partial [Gammaproteobacteria bacterium]
MEKEGHFIAVGAFLILALAAGTAFLLWLGASRTDHDTHRYAIDFEGSVSGLDIGNDVRYLGVRVGRVVDIRLLPERPTDVRVLVDIRDGTPLTRNTVAQLKLQGITGIAFVELRQEAGPTTPVEPRDEPPWPVIASRKSTLDQFFDSLPDLVENLEILAKRGQGLLSDENLENTEQLLASLRQTSKNLPGLTEQAWSMLDEAERTLKV